MAEVFDPVREAKVLLHLSEEAVITQKPAATQALVNELTELQKKPEQLKAVVDKMEIRSLWSHIWVEDTKNRCGDPALLIVHESSDRATSVREPKSLTIDLTVDHGKRVLPSCIISD